MRTNRRQTMLRYGVFSFVLLLLLAACGESHEQMLRQLTELERMNRADSVMQNDTLAEQLTQYFDRHGDSNERMRAHYILGRTYADMGEAPAAINAYLDAADCADTTATDCDYHTLSRVYGQMADVFYEQNLIEDNLSSADYASYYAWKDHDTIQALSEQMLKIGTYIYMKQHDLVITLFDSLYQQILYYYGEEIASQYCTLPVASLLENSNTSKASSYLDIYRMKSGYFDSLGNIEKGREAYYYLKGLLCNSLNQTDSAVFYFRKELQEGTDIANQSMAAHGLSLAYQKMNKADSAAKYGIISYEMNDSAYYQIATEEVAKTKSLYNYHRHQAIANKEHLRAEKKSKENRQLYELLILVCGVACFSTYTWYRKKKAAAAILKNKMEELERLNPTLTPLVKSLENFEVF